MDVFPVNWDSVPEVMNKEQFFRICHISKSTALHLLKSGKVPCEWSGKKTRCYKIRKEDVKAYLEERAIFPELYRLMLKDYPDVMDIGQMCEALGVSTKTGYKLLKDGKIEYLKIGRAYRIPKAHILRYLKITCSTFAE